MHVTRVELENIKSYDKADYQFHRGTTAITGENGAGKTTILEAIAWALFDTLEYNKEDFLKRGAKKGTVRVTFESDVDQRLYVVYRDTGNGYYLFDPALGIRLAEKKVDVSTLLRKLLGIEPGTDVKSLFRSAIGVAQGTFTAEFLLPANARKAAFDRLLKVEEYRESADRLRETVNLLRERIADVRERIAGAEGQLARYDEQVAAQTSLQEKVTEFEGVLSDLRIQISALSSEVEKSDRAEDRLNEARSRKARSEVEREAAVRRLKDAGAERQVAASAVERQAALEPDYKAHLDSLATLQELEKKRLDRDALRAESSRLDRTLVAARADLRRFNEALERANAARLAIDELTGAIKAQEELEKERERLRDLRSRALSERARLSGMDTELDQLRKLHAQLKSQAKEAEQSAGALERAERLESERLGIETELSKVEKATTSLGHLRGQRAGELKEIERLKREIAVHQKEIARIDKSAARALDAPTLLAREQQVTEQLARLRAEIARDEKFHTEVHNGLCPILSQRCLNIAEGQTLEDYFNTSFAENTAQVNALQSEHSALSLNVKEAREAEKHLGRLETVHKQLTTDSEQLQRREAQLAAIDAEIATLSYAAPDKLRELRLQLLGIDGELKLAREAALKAAELQPLLQRLEEIEEEGKRKRDERESVAAAAAAAETLTNELTELERRLSSLKDPRARSMALKAEGETAPARFAELSRAEDAEKKLQEEAMAVDQRMVQFAELDPALHAAVTERDRTAAAHRDYVTFEVVARTLPSREAEFARAELEASKASTEAEAALSEFEEAAKGYDREAHLQARASLLSLREKSASVTAQLDAARLQNTNLLNEISRLDEVRATMREEFKSRERLEQLRETTEFIRETLKTAGPIVTESYLFNISVEANQLFREISGEGGRTLRWTRDYEIIIEEDGYERSFPNLSGGEQMAAALSIRLALLKQLSDIRLAFFDEPTTNMDAERRERLAQQIGQVRHFDQLFVISHDDTFEESVDNIIHVQRQNDRLGSSTAALVP